MTQSFKAAVVALAGAAALTSAGCTRPAGRQATTAATQERPAIAVAVQPVLLSEITDTVDVVGSLAPKFSAEVKSEVSGIVKAVYVTQWVPVRKGTPLARLDTSETEAGLDALKALDAQARVAEVRARREYDRARQLKQYGLITPQGLDDAKSALEASEAAAAAARAQVRTGEARLAKSAINAPMDGVVAERNISVGDRVENVGGNGPMFRIVDNRLLNLTVTVPTPKLAGVRVGQRLEFTTDAMPGRTFAGNVMFINPAVDVASRSAKVIAEVPNPDGALKGGLFVNGRIVLGTRRGVLQVARDAVLNWDVARGTAVVFVVRNGRAEQRAVKIGGATGPLVEIVSGLAGGEEVVTRGAFALKGGDRVAPARGGA